MNGREWCRGEGRQYAIRALHGERERVKRWMLRHDPETGEHYDMWNAIRATAENSPTFDDLWDDEMEPRFHLMGAGVEAHAVVEGADGVQKGRST